MPNNGHYTLCPYYRDEKNKSISCEDIFRRFDSKRKKYKWMEQFCDDSWSDCPYAIALTEMWERILDGADMDKEQMEHKIKELTTELKKQSSRLGRLDKQIEKKDAEIKKLKDRAERLIAMVRDAQDEARETKAAYTHIVTAEVNRLSTMYEGYISFLMDKTNVDELSVDEVEKWCENKEFKLTATKRDEDGRPTVFVAEVREVKEDDDKK